MLRACKHDRLYISCSGVRVATCLSAYTSDRHTRDTRLYTLEQGGQFVNRIGRLVGLCGIHQPSSLGYDGVHL